MNDLKDYQKVAIRRKVHSALSDKGIKRGSGLSYRNHALRAVIALGLFGAEFDYARSVVNEWLEGK